MCGWSCYSRVFIRTVVYRNATESTPAATVNTPVVVVVVVVAIVVASVVAIVSGVVLRDTRQTSEPGGLGTGHREVV